MTNNDVYTYRSTWHTMAYGTAFGLRFAIAEGKSAQTSIDFFTFVPSTFTCVFFQLQVLIPS